MIRDLGKYYTTIYIGYHMHCRRPRGPPWGVVAEMEPDKGTAVPDGAHRLTIATFFRALLEGLSEAWHMS